MGTKLKAHPSSNAVNASALHSSQDREKRRRPAEGGVSKEFQTVDFSSLDIKVLRRYARVHDLNVASGSSKEDLVAAVSRHFAGQTVKEADTIACFLYTARYRDSVLRLPLHV